MRINNQFYYNHNQRCTNNGR